jgi:hypothetical protein
VAERAQRRRPILWRAGGAGILLMAWALDAAWRRRWLERWEYFSPSAGVVLAGDRWDRRRRFTRSG